MLLIDRYILGRFFANYLILFVLLFLFALGIDLVLSLHRYVEAAARITENGAFVARAIVLLRLVADFQGPRIFQFYAFMHGLLAIAAMGFTVAQMKRHRELLAMLIAGLSLQRIAMPFVVGVFILSVIQIVNQEIFLPRVASRLLRDQGQIGQRTTGGFPIALTTDGEGNLFHAPRFDPRTRELTGLTIIQPPTELGVRRRITAASATWHSEGQDLGGQWVFSNGQALVVREGTDELGMPSQELQDIDVFATDLSPRVLLMRRYGAYATMLSLRQIGQMLATPGVRERNMLLRQRYARFAVVFVNVLVMWIALPTFLDRAPVNLMHRAVLCAALSIPALLGAGVAMMVDLPGIGPAVGVFLPVLILLPVAIAQWTRART